MFVTIHGIHRCQTENLNLILSLAGLAKLGLLESGEFVLGPEQNFMGFVFRLISSSTGSGNSLPLEIHANHTMSETIFVTIHWILWCQTENLNLLLSLAGLAPLKF
jgi:hypothetical protein